MKDIVASSTLSSSSPWRSAIVSLEAGQWLQAPELHQELSEQAC